MDRSGESEDAPTMATGQSDSRMLLKASEREQHFTLIATGTFTPTLDHTNLILHVIYTLEYFRCYMTYNVLILRQTDQNQTKLIDEIIKE